MSNSPSWICCVQQLPDIFPTVCMSSLLPKPHGLSASQLEAHLQAASVEQFAENHNIIEQSAHWAANWAPQQCPQRCQPKCWHWNGLDTHICIIAWGLPHAQRWLLWMLNTPSYIKHTSSVHRTLCKRSPSAVCWCCSHLQNCVPRGQSPGSRYVRLIIMKHFEDPCLG
jgi:hypothetical protein